MRWPQIAVIVLYALSLGITLAKHGEPQSPYNFWTSLLGVAIAVGLLIAGGLFK